MLSEKEHIQGCDDTHGMNMTEIDQAMIFDVCEKATGIKICVQGMSGEGMTFMHECPIQGNQRQVLRQNNY